MYAYNTVGVATNNEVLYEGHGYVVRPRFVYKCRRPPLVAGVKDEPDVDAVWHI